MQSRSDNSNLSSDLTAQPENVLSETFPSEIQQPKPSEGSELVFSSSVSRILSASPGKLLIAGLILAGILATFLVFSQGSHFCFLSYCLDNPVPAVSIGNDFLAFTGGTASLILLSTMLGTPLLPAIGIASGVWFLLHMSLH
jgi:hypothetical protein